jgi:hypothetical protein
MQCIAGGEMEGLKTQSALTAKMGTGQGWLKAQAQGLFNIIRL